MISTLSPTPPKKIHTVNCFQSSSVNFFITKVADFGSDFFVKVIDSPFKMIDIYYPVPKDRPFITMLLALLWCEQVYWLWLIMYAPWPIALELNLQWFYFMMSLKPTPTIIAFDRLPIFNLTFFSFKLGPTASMSPGNFQPSLAVLFSFES